MMWPVKLCFYQRLSISLVAVFLLILSLFTVASSRLQNALKNEGEQRLHSALAQQLVTDNPVLQQALPDFSQMQNVFNTLMLLGPNFEFYFLDPKGKILLHSKEINELALDYIALEPIKRFLAAEPVFPIVGTDPRSFNNEEKIFSVAPVLNGEHLQGYFYVIIGGERYDSIVDNLQKSHVVQFFALVVGAGTLFLLFALLLLFKFFTAPLKELSDDMDKFRAHGFSLDGSGIKPKPWRDDSRNEVQRLGNSFNDMIRHIDEQMKQLKRTDSERRSLLADISHDLRTPLANLQGYIETLSLKSESLSADERQRFIDISLKNLFNLKHLIDQIFELAYLEGGQVTVKKENILLAELLHDITAKFFLKAEKKSIQIRLDTDINHLYVYADIGKLERVLTNLIDNAIRHTPSHGEIGIRITEENQTVTVEVRDNGVGISATDIAYIFNARYQAANNQPDTCMHAGLGLAISQKLMALLGSKLEVSSTLGEGTCFSFSLPIMRL